ncbi:uncharacterized protein LOC122939682 isoform X2 [Bufo gargarizans]|uniref:uncharacterized protein LOC122939682 isoform X2 n=1 Tax=Bufo gargarizans TaxID=30331 RepID=UPI001CF23002|nr:uncharacterized protein LOC122939682 isoform X2 [Bufo gargarizans]
MSQSNYFYRNVTKQSLSSGSQDETERTHSQMETEFSQRQPSTDVGRTSTHEPRQEEAVISPPATRPRGTVPRGRGRRSLRGGHARGRCGTGSRSHSGEDVPTNIHFDQELLIHFVEERPALWDQSQRLHADHIATRRLWSEIFRALLENWENMTDHRQQACGEIVVIRWRSMRDRFIRDLHTEKNLPSGSGSRNSRPYRYAPLLQFLRRSAEMMQIK